MVELIILIVSLIALSLRDALALRPVRRLSLIRALYPQRIRNASEGGRRRVAAGPRDGTGFSGGSAARARGTAAPGP